ncbi:hypothetical protein KQ718_16390, partial [Listeria monocytogenes]|nr:hypothetical protein [Listeria monocytogenes]
ELRDAVLDDPVGVLVVYVHEYSCCQAMRLTALTTAHGYALHAEWAHDTSSYLCVKVMFEYMVRTKKTKSPGKHNRFATAPFLSDGRRWS